MAKQEVKLVTIKNVFFYYSRLTDPVLTKNAKDKGIKTVGEEGQNGEYVVKVAMTEPEFRKLKKGAETKGAKNFPNVKEFTNAEFKAAFHAEDDNMPDFDEDEDIVVVKFAQKAYNDKSKKPMKAPALIGIKGKVQDNAGNSIAQDTLMGNGTKGHLQVRPVDFGEYGLYLYPNAVCVTDLVVYEGGEGVGVDEDAFGIEELDDGLDEEVAGSEGDDDFDDDIPF